MPTISAATSPRQPSFWMTALSLLVAGSVAGLFASVWMPYLPAGQGSVCRSSTRRWSARSSAESCCGRSCPVWPASAVSYPWAVVAIGLGSFAGNAATVVAQTITARHVPVAVAPLVSANPLFVLGGAALRLLVSYRVIVFAGRAAAARQLRPRRPAAAARRARERRSRSRSRPNAERRRADLHRGQPLGGGRDPRTGRRCADRARHLAHMLRHATPPDPETRAAVAQLLDGLERFQDALTDIATGCGRARRESPLRAGPRRRAGDDPRRVRAAAVARSPPRRVTATGSSAC